MGRTILTIVFLGAVLTLLLEAVLAFALLATAANAADCLNSTLPTQTEVQQAMRETGVAKAPAIYTACDLKSRKHVDFWYDATNPVAQRQGYPGSIILDDSWRAHDGLRQAFRQMAGQSAGAPKAASLMPRVEQSLVGFGYDVRGYSRLSAPSVRTAEMPRSTMARIDGMTITLNALAPQGCDDVLIGHELAHDALSRILRISATSRQSEDAATEVAWALAENPYRPNCVTGNRIGGHAGDYESKFETYPRGYFGPRR